MTIPASNWCSTCEQSCSAHTSICTTCGDTLGPPPSTNTTRSSSSYTGIRAVPEFLTDDINQASQELRSLLVGLRGQVQDIDAARGAVGNGDQWQQVPAHLLAPQNDQHKGRPTAKETLRTLPRTVIDDNSAVLRQASLEFFSSVEGSTSEQIQTIPAEFGPASSFEADWSVLIIASPRTAKGGLSDDTKTAISRASEPIVFMERGDGVTFAAKAIQAQRAGAAAVVIGNNMSSPWPYIMKDSKGEAKQCGLSIPVAMVKQADGNRLVQECGINHTTQVRAKLKIQSLTKDCVVCCENLCMKQTVLQIPSCGHVFHEQCALAWLNKHNTCPYCRRELPTDDEEYEAERRRVQRTHAGSSSNNHESGWGDFYG